MKYPTAVVIASLLLVFPQVTLPTEVRMVNICYVPIGVATFVPITPENIDKHCARIGQIDSTDRRYLEIQSLLQGAAAGSFDSDAVRVKLTEVGGESIFIDNAGGIRSGGAELRLNAAALAKLKRLVERLTVANSR